ncbi:3D domain-containing protein [Bacillaceae bacterium W0354]
MKTFLLSLASIVVIGTSWLFIGQDVSKINDNNTEIINISNVTQSTLALNDKKNITVIEPKKEQQTASTQKTSTPKHTEKQIVQVSEQKEGKTMFVTATAYTANCDGCSGVTYTGINLHENPNMKVIAVDPNVIPIGSKVWVEGYGTAIAGDIGGAIKGNRIDVFVPNQEEAKRYGIKQVRIKIIE